MIEKNHLEGIHDLFYSEKQSRDHLSTPSFNIDAQPTLPYS